MVIRSPSSTPGFVDYEACELRNAGLWRTKKLTRREHRQLIALVAVGVEGKAPAVLTAEVAQAAQLGRGVAQPLQILLARFRPVRGRPVARQRRAATVGSKDPTPRSWHQ